MRTKSSQIYFYTCLSFSLSNRLIIVSIVLKFTNNIPCDYLKQCLFIFRKMIFLNELLPFFHFSLRFIYKFED